MLTSTFAPIALIDRPDYLPFWERTPQRAADYTFTNLWGWSAHYGLEWRVEHDLCWIRQTGFPMSDAGTERFWAPLGDWEAADWAAMPHLTPGLVLHRVPERLCELLLERLPGRVVVEETRGQWEYLYATQDLATLSGNRLHKKRNHVNGYMKAYGENYREITKADIPTVLQLQQDWCAWRGCDQSPSLTAESDVICQVMQRWDALPELVGGALYVEGKMVAFSVGEPLDDTTMVVHFEKALPDYRGVYQAMNFCFAKYAGAAYELLDREQDSDEEGLRQAKESYYPAGFLKKNTVRFI